MRAGTLSHTITLQSPTGSRDAVGERVTTWVNVAEDVPANIQPITGREQLVAAQLQATTSHIVRLRYASLWGAIDASWRVLFGSRVFTIDAPPKNVGERNVELILQCTEGDRQE